MGRSKKPKRPKLHVTHKEMTWDEETMELYEKGRIIVDWTDITVEDAEHIINELTLHKTKYYLYLDEKFMSAIPADVGLILYKGLETFKHEDNLWISLVDSNRYISNEFYCANTYEENFAIYQKMLAFRKTPEYKNTQWF